MRITTTIRLFPILFLLLSSITFGSNNDGHARTKILDLSLPKRVYICKGPESYRYHSRSNCRGLNNCTTEVYPVTIAHAKRINRTACKICL